MRALKKLFNRFYSDYLLPNRFEEYKRILSIARKYGFKICSIFTYVNEVLIPKKFDQKILILRHDIDTDSEAALEFYKCEAEFDCNASYFFRLATLNLKTMTQLIQVGADIGYHYEEIATFIKLNCIKNESVVLNHLGTLRTELKKNISIIENKLNAPIHTIASHGDFINRYLNIPNHRLVLENGENIHFPKIISAYEKRIIDSFDAYITDCPYPNFYNPIPVIDALQSKQRILFLTHPKHWRVNVFETSKENFNRVFEALSWKWGIRVNLDGSPL